MSITSSNNLAVSNSLTVSGNTILGSDNTKTLIVNSLQTFNNGTTINGNITQNSGILNTTSDTNYLNGNVIIGAYKTLTTGGGTTTINGLTQANNNIYVLSGKSLSITDSIISKYLRNYHDGTNAYIDHTGDLNFRNSGTTTSLTLSGTNNQGTFNYVLNTKGITNGTTTLTNNSTLTQNGLSYFADNIRVSSGKSVYITDATTSNYVRLHLSSGSSFIDFTGDLNIRNAGTTYPLTISSSTNQGTFNYNLNTTGITNSGTLTQNSTANINSALNVTGLPFFDGTSNQTLPTVASGNAGLSIYWNGTASAHGETNFMNNAQGGDGGFAWHSRTSGAVPRMLMYLNANGSLSSIKDVGMSGNCTIGGNCSVSGTINITEAIGTTSIVNDSTFNNSWYYSLKGSSYNDATVGQTYIYTKYNGTTSTASSETIGINLTKCKCFKIQYAYDTRNGGLTTYKGYTEWIFIKSVCDFTNTWTQYTGTQVGNSGSYVPTITTTSTSMTIGFPTNSGTAELVYWNFAIYII